MIAVSDAVTRLLSAAQTPSRAESVALDQSLGRILAVPIRAPIDVPQADNSAMDGYAIRFDDWRGEGMPVSQYITAGSQSQPLDSGTAARIFTGAPIPPGADTVVMQENCEAMGNSVRITASPVRGQYVRSRAQDIAAGTVIFEAGHRLRAQDLGLIASVGIATVSVFAPLKVAVFSTGNELAEPGQPAGPAQVYDANRFTIQAQLRTWGFDCVDHGVVVDDLAAVTACLQAAAGSADVIIGSGGVSVGEEDHIRDALAATGSVDWWRVAVKPGKPLAFGRVRQTPFFGLPGNPASVWVTLLILVRPYLFRAQGMAETAVAAVPQRALFERAGGSREEYLRVRLEADGIALHPNQCSGVLRSAGWGDGLAVQRTAQDIHRGDTVDFISYSSLA